MPKFIDLTNTETEFFEIMGLSHTKRRKGRPRSKLYFYKCKCKKCGSLTVVRKEYLGNGHTKSCGCSLRKSKSDHKDWKGVGQSSSRFSEIKHSAKVRNLDFEIGIDFAWKLFEEQEGLCALTKLPMCMGKNNKNRGNASMDRIDNSKGYVPGNVRWVLIDVNLMRRDMSDEELLDYCQRIIETCGNID